MDKHIIDKLARALSRIQTGGIINFQMFMGECSERACQTFLVGFEEACDAAGIRITMQHRELAASRRGWEGPAERLGNRMQDQGFSEEEIVNELLLIEIEAVRLVLPVYFL